MQKIKWALQKTYYRTFQKIQKQAIKVIKFPEQKLYTGMNSLNNIPSILIENKISNILVSLSLYSSRNIHEIAPCYEI